MLTFILLVILLVGGYCTVRYFLKNKEAREGLANQIEADAAKVKKDLTKIIDKKKKK